MDLFGMMGIDIDTIAKDAKEFIGLLGVMDTKIAIINRKLDAIMVALEIEDTVKEIEDGPENTVKQLAKS